MSNVLTIIQGFLRNKLQNNPNIPQAPWVEPAINAIMNGDAKVGEEIADNLCKSMGASREDVIKMAQQNLPNLLGRRP